MYVDGLKVDPPCSVPRVVRGGLREKLTLPGQVLVLADVLAVGRGVECRLVVERRFDVERGLGVVPAVGRAAEVVGRVALISAMIKQWRLLLTGCLCHK